MKSLNVGTLLAAALVTASANSTPIADGRLVSVIDVDFWGRQEFRTENIDTQEYTYSYGDPVQGTFRIWLDNAPPARPSVLLNFQDARVYGRDTVPVGPNPTPASFVTSRMITVPTGFPAEAWSSPSGDDDFVRIGDSVRFLGPDDTPQDWFVVSEGSTERFGLPGERRNSLFINVSTPIDIIQGVGLEQEFELATPIEEGGVGSGFLNTIFEGAQEYFRFAIERLHVSSDTFVCRR